MPSVPPVPPWLLEWSDPLVALGTFALALATGWLAWRTHSMAGATREVAAQTKLLADATVEMARQTERAAQATEQMLGLERDRYQDESTASVLPLGWSGTFGLTVQNSGRAPTVVRLVVVAKPWRYRDMTMPINPGESKALGTQGWEPLGMHLPDQPDVGQLPGGKTWAMVRWDGGESGWIVVDDR
jgi:hypothetical protein